MAWDASESCHEKGASSSPISDCDPLLSPLSSLQSTSVSVGAKNGVWLVDAASAMVLGGQGQPPAWVCRVEDLSSAGSDWRH